MNFPAPPLENWRPLFVADWTDFLFVHYSLPAGDLAPFTPLALDTRDGRAFVSLVCFRFARMRPAALFPAPVGRWLMQPMSDHWFLNVRTYVRGPAGPGIQFLIEWMDNPVSLHLGPWLYGLPYERGHFERPAVGRAGEASVCVTDVATRNTLQISYRDPGAEGVAAKPGSLDEFLLEKYTAYTHRRDTTRFFRIAHPRWKFAVPTLTGVDDTLLRQRCPWLARGEIVAAHTAAGFPNIPMGFPHTLPLASGARPLCPALN